MGLFDWLKSKNDCCSEQKDSDEQGNADFREELFDMINEYFDPQERQQAETEIKTVLDEFFGKAEEKEAKP